MLVKPSWACSWNPPSRTREGVTSTTTLGQYAGCIEMESFHFCRNGVVIKFRLEWNAHSIPAGMEWLLSIPVGMKWTLHSNHNGLNTEHSIPGRMKCTRDISLSRDLIVREHSSITSAHLEDGEVGANILHCRCWGGGGGGRDGKICA